MRRGAEESSLDTAGIIHALSRLNLNSVTHALLQNARMAGAGGATVDSVLQTALNLEQWDVRAPETPATGHGVLFKVLQGINNAQDQPAARKAVDLAILDVLNPLMKPDHFSRSAHSSYRTLGILVEIDDVTSANSLAQVDDAWQNMRSRQDWMESSQ